MTQGGPVTSGLVSKLDKLTLLHLYTGRRSFCLTGSVRDCARGRLKTLFSLEFIRCGCGMEDYCSVSSLLIISPLR